MINSNSKNRMCDRSDDEFGAGDYEEDYENNGVGGKVRVRRYSDGTATHYFGGPAGKVNTNQYGEEC